MKVTVALASKPHEVHEWVIEVDAACSIAQAMTGIDWKSLVPAIQLHEYELSVWGRRCDSHALLAEGDRIELTRPLRVDPKVARRERFQRQGVRTAGLFQRRSKT